MRLVVDHRSDANPHQPKSQNRLPELIPQMVAFDRSSSDAPQGLSRKKEREAMMAGLFFSQTAATQEAYQLAPGADHGDGTDAVLLN